MRSPASVNRSNPAHIPNRSRRCGDRSPSSGYMLATRINDAGCRIRSPSRSTIFSPRPCTS
ncbi:MAG: hypothetical protein QMD85_05560, partial [Candidatus Aenigmarchaeota archaeon]|nr:hypothetical protein [Candidatus Aenigmarchaeota archaeon]